MRYVLPVLMVVFLAAWFLNWPILSRQFDLQSCAEQYRFWRARVPVYEFMFLSLAIVCFFSTRELTKALSCFSVIIITGSLIDKIFFGITYYVVVDIVLIILGILASYIVYGRDRRRTS